MTLCPDCLGSGHGMLMHNREMMFWECFRCAGTGTVERPSVADPANIRCVAYPLTAHVVVTVRQLKVAGNANAAKAPKKLRKERACRTAP